MYSNDYYGFLDASSFSSDFDAAYAFLALHSTELLIASAVLILLYFIAWCRIVSKAHRSWPLLLIPVYGSYLRYSIADCGGIFWTNIILTGLASVATYFLSYLPTITMILWAFVSFILFVLHIIYCTRLSESFRKGAFFTIGLLLLNPFFILILGFGRARKR